jgi:uracil-DNA glycosylase
MFDRDVILREIGLVPIWRTREQSKFVETSESAIERDAAPATAAVAEATHVALDPKERAARIASLDWDALNADIALCTACKLCKTRTNTVPGVGSRSPQWMVIGEGPGENEDKQGEPFVGRAGQLLDHMLAAVGMSRKKNVFIANVVKCRPPGNRDRQIALAQPKLFLAVGKFAGQHVLNTDATVGAMREKPGVRGGVPVVVTYHPAYLLRAPQEKSKTWTDLVAAKRLTKEETPE